MLSDTELRNIGINPEQAANLIKLADYLKSLPKDYLHFDMNWFCRNCREFGEVDINDFRQYDCGTVGCAVGHGPAAGIPIDGYTTWNDYADQFVSSEALHTFEWLFGNCWAYVDNHPHSTADRILWTLENGLPDIPDPWYMDDYVRRLSPDDLPYLTKEES